MNNPRDKLIRHLAASRSGVRVAAAEFERDVNVWDIHRKQVIGMLHTELDFGGQRLAISADGAVCGVGSYQSSHVTCYAIDSGSELWRQNIIRPQYIGFTPGDEHINVGTDHGCHILRRETGVASSRVSNVNRIFNSPWGGVAVLSGKQLRVQRGHEHVDIIPRLTFAELDVDFSPDRVFISESAGPIRCWDVGSKAEVWRYWHEDHHALRLCYSVSETALFAVELGYRSSGGPRLLRFDPINGQMTFVAELRDAWETTFCLEGTRMITAGGEIIETTTGIVVGELWGA